MSEEGAIAAKIATDVNDLEDGYFTCTQKIWKVGRAEVDKIRSGAGGWDAKHGKLMSIEKTFEKKAEATCAPEMKKYEVALVKTIEARDAERTALFQKVKVKVQ